MKTFICDDKDYTDGFIKGCGPIDYVIFDGGSFGGL